MTKEIMDELETESLEAKEECTHENTEQDENNKLFCLTCGADLSASQSENE